MQMNFLFLVTINLTTTAEDFNSIKIKSEIIQSSFHKKIRKSSHSHAMGVQHLTTFAKEQKQPPIYNQINILDEIQQWRA